MGEQLLGHRADHLVDLQLQSEGKTIVAKSRWHTWSKTRYTVVDGAIDRADGQMSYRFLVVTEAVSLSTGMKISNVPEFQNPKSAECPPSLLNLLEGHPPVNALAAKWRKRARAVHRENNRRGALFQKLRKRMKHGTPKVVLDCGRVVDYALMRQNGRKVSAYRNEHNGMVYRLPHDIVDIEATVELLKETEASTQGRTRSENPAVESPHVV